MTAVTLDNFFRDSFHCSSSSFVSFIIPSLTSRACVLLPSIIGIHVCIIFTVYIPSNPIWHLCKEKSWQNRLLREITSFSKSSNAAFSPLDYSQTSESITALVQPTSIFIFTGKTHSSRGCVSTLVLGITQWTKLRKSSRRGRKRRNSNTRRRLSLSR